MAEADDTAVEIAGEISANLRGYGGAQDYQRLGRCRALMNALGTDDPATAYVALKEAVEALGDGRDARALSNGMNINPVTAGRLHQRREQFGHLHGRRSAEAVKQWEAKAIDALARSLASRRGVESAVATITVRGYVHNLLLSRLVIEREYADLSHRPEGREELVTVNQPWLHSVVFSLQPNERPETVEMVINWSGQRPHHFFIYQYLGLSRFSINEHSTFQHIADNDHHPVHPVSRIQLTTPNPEMVYVVRWPTLEEATPEPPPSGKMANRQER